MIPYGFVLWCLIVYYCVICVCVVWIMVINHLVILCIVVQVVAQVLRLLGGSARHVNCVLFCSALHAVCTCFHVVRWFGRLFVCLFACLFHGLLVGLLGCMFLLVA